MSLDTTFAFLTSSPVASINTSSLLPGSYRTGNEVDAIKVQDNGAIRGQGKPLKSMVGSLVCPRLREGIIDGELWCAMYKSQVPHAYESHPLEVLLKIKIFKTLRTAPTVPLPAFGESLRHFPTTRGFGRPLKFSQAALGWVENDSEKHE
jgi:hypothetical protein